MVMEAWWREQGDLDDDQLEVIGLPEDGSYLVLGPPGSGKTNLLLLRANYLNINFQPNLAIVVFTGPLREFIRSGADRYDFDVNNVVTSASLFDRLLLEAGEHIPRTGDFRTDRMARLEAVNRVVLTGRQDPIFDVLLVDEAQDFLQEEMTAFRNLTRDLFLVADSRQMIYETNSPIRNLEGIVERTLRLRFHYRNGPDICEVADAIGRTFSSGYEPIVPTCNYDSSQFRASVNVIQGTQDAQIEELERRLELQRRTYPEGFLGIICPRSDDARMVARQLGKGPLAGLLCHQDSAEGYQQIQAGKPIWISTVHGAKGLEFRAVHFVSAEGAARVGPAQKRLAYTAVTRAKTALSVYHERHLPPYLASAVARFRPASDRPADIGAAFGNR